MQIHLSNHLALLGGLKYLLDSVLQEPCLNDTYQIIHIVVRVELDARKCDYRASYCWCTAHQLHDVGDQSSQTCQRRLTELHLLDLLLDGRIKLPTSPLAAIDGDRRLPFGALAA